MTGSAVIPDVTRRIAELRFCVSELRRRQTTDQLRAWLWRLKEHAAHQALIMLQRRRGDDSSVILGSSERAELLARHSLLQDPRPCNTALRKSRWERQLRGRVEAVLPIVAKE